MGRCGMGGEKERSEHARESRCRVWGWRMMDEVESVGVAGAITARGGLRWRVSPWAHRRTAM